jgi:hypothetical protein
VQSDTSQISKKVIVEPISIALLKEHSKIFFNSRMATIRAAIRKNRNGIIVP